MQPGRARTSGLGVPLLPLARWVGRVGPVHPTHGVLVLSCPSAALRVRSVPGLLAPVHRCARVVCCVVSAVSWATWLLFTGAPARCGVLRVRCPGPLGSRSPVCTLGVLCCVCGVLGHLAPGQRCARLVCCFACAVSWATWLLFTGVPALSFVLFVWCPGPLGSCSPVCPRGLLCCVCNVLGHLAPVHRCAPSMLCVACAVSQAPWLPLTGVNAGCVVLRVRCPGPLGSCSPVRPLGVLLCVRGVLGHLDTVHQCACSVFRFVCAVSWATWLLFTMCPLSVLFCVRGVLGLLAPVHRCARPWCPVPLLPSVHVRLRCPGPRGGCSPVCALCAVRVCRRWLCPSSSPPNFRFFLFSFSVFFLKLKKGGRAYPAGTGTGSWCSGAIVLFSLACVVRALVAVAPQGCGSLVLMYTGMGQGGFGWVPLCFWCWLVRRLRGLWVWAVATLLPRRASLVVKGWRFRAVARV